MASDLSAEPSGLSRGGSGPWSGTAIVNDTYGFYLGQPWWLLAACVLVPMMWLARRNLAALGRTRRIAAIVSRAVVVLLLVVLLARPMLVRKSRRATVIAVVDRSLSIPAELAGSALDYLSRAASLKQAPDQFAVVNAAEAARIAKLPSSDTTVPRRSTMLTGRHTSLAKGVEMAMAIAPPDTATRIVLISEGNETEGDLKAVSRTAAANKIPIDVLPLRYQYTSEVLFKRLAAPPRARSGQTISLRFILDSTAAVSGKLLLTLNDRPVDLAPGTDEVAVPVRLKEGTNVKTVSLPVGTAGVHMFEAVFMPDEPEQDRVTENNRASAMTYVAGPGQVCIFDVDGGGADLARALEQADIQVRRADVGEMPSELPRLLDVDAVILVNTPIHQVSLAQQEMLCRYVTDLGGGLAMVGGPESFGAGGWIDSPVAEILPVDMDPPQKKQMPRGALVLVIDRSGSMTGEKVHICKVAAAAAVRLLSRLDLVGVVAFDAESEWSVPLQSAENKADICRTIGEIRAGGGTIMGPAMQLAFEALDGVEAGIRHVILLTDGRTSDAPECTRLGQDLAGSGITVSTVAVGPEADNQLLYDIAAATEGRFYRVTDLMNIPEIFVKEAQVVRRTMIVEQTFAPQIVSALSETIKGLSLPLPALDGYVLTGPKGGLNQLVLSSHEADPILAICQSGLGRCAAFTSSVDSRWAGSWLQWPEFSRFWEQVVRWAGKPGQSSDCEIFVDVEGREAAINVEASDAQGRFLPFASIEGQVLTPEMKAESLPLTQTGPGRYSGRFRAPMSGSFVVNVRYRKTGPEPETRLANAVVTIPFAPEFRDLSDNASLLEEVAQITGGRVLPSDPNEANLYEYAGLKFPETHLPLLRPLMLAWIAFFLLDVAVRRVVVDVRGALRRIRSWVSAAARRQEDETITRLRARRQKLREQWSGRTLDSIATRRYDGAEQYEGELLSGEPRHRAETDEKPPGAEPEKKPTPAPGSHIDQLLRARREKSENEDAE